MDLCCCLLTCILVLVLVMTLLKMDPIIDEYGI